MGATSSQPDDTQEQSSSSSQPYVSDGDSLAQSRFTIHSLNYLPTQQEEISFSEFEPLKVIGKGSFGKVLLVRKKSNNKVYALKMLRKSKIIQLREVEHTNTERKLLTQIVHPFVHICTSYSSYLTLQIYSHVTLCLSNQKESLSCS